ncbi:fimbrial protein [Paraburkholderia sp. HP33-1]|uniref:fimbrial protein n=1 Tax=Paraburkholderia sp. HP33-1 TaxID=2883243 RepID=UPI001F25D2F3|nr:fimbrial protein [Paraburkholderia sp. HP33-1]
MKKLIQIFLGILIVACSSGVHAACLISGVGSMWLTSAPPVIDPGNSQPGTVLFSSVLTPANRTTILFKGCTQLTATGTGAKGPYNTFSTGIPGVGVRFSWPGFGGAGYFPVTRNVSDPYTLDPAYLSNPTFELVQTDTIKPGNYSLGQLVFGVSGGGDVAYFYIGQGINSNLPVVIKQRPTCGVTTPSIQVPLGSVPLKSFSGVGSTSPIQPSFNIALSCAGGSDGVVTSVYTTLTDQTNPANESNTLSLSASSTASGIGIQVLNGNNVISYGPDSAVVGNPNQWLAGSTGNGAFNIPLTARYVQTAPNVTAGTANGIATFTMSYQ